MGVLPSGGDNFVEAASGLILGAALELAERQMSQPGCCLGRLDKSRTAEIDERVRGKLLNDTGNNRDLLTGLAQSPSAAERPVRHCAASKP